MKVTGTPHVLGEVCKIAAFTRESFVAWASYRSRFVLSITWQVVSAFTFCIFSTVVPGEQIIPVVATYGTPNYLSFFVIGMMINQVLWFTEGTGDTLKEPSFVNRYMSPTRLPTILIGSRIWLFLYNSISLPIFLFVGSVFFNLRININWLSATMVLLVGFTLLLALDIASAGITIVTKTPDPISFFLRGFQELFAGLWFPVEYLPGWARAISAVIPQTHIYRLARLTIGGGRSLSEIWPLFWKLLLISLVLVLMASRIFPWGFNRAREEGTLGHR